MTDLELSIISSLKKEGMDKFQLSKITGRSVAEVQEILNALQKQRRIVSGLERKEGTGDYERIYRWGRQTPTALPTNTASETMVFLFRIFFKLIPIPRGVDAYGTQQHNSDN